MHTKALSFVIATILAIALMSQGYTQAVTDEQKEQIRKMSPEELYEEYTNQAIKSSVVIARSQGAVLSEKQIQTLHQCTKNVVKSTLTPDDLRTMFIQPLDMDYNYYNKKLNLLIYKQEKTCFN